MLAESLAGCYAPIMLGHHFRNSNNDIGLFRDLENARVAKMICGRVPAQIASGFSLQ